VVEHTPSPVPVTPGTKSLPDDLSELLDIIQQARGRLTQKDLRSKMRCSEAKVSLMITDLEDRGLVHKVKRGGEYYTAKIQGMSYKLNIISRL